MARQEWFQVSDLVIFNHHLQQLHIVDHRLLLLDQGTVLQGNIVVQDVQLAELQLSIKM